ncbi:zinc-binding protein [Candidatus Shapirobacteria bacterium CG_4_9_14_0_2_um_filter_39_11]|uniref:Zinc-binding protein n=1 Tax=Candidatus Shapirobacteria bacterium CG_4_9_14_0_2_um_filter_39_11 TaxID=1974478 RepID=A0A2M8ESL3_9BACT|nr:MAG: zinc-binding protein [Candidatus Shapirobacteria bacterium CG_4_9_14_0_2_um_filter_39_11]
MADKKKTATEKPKVEDKPVAEAKPVEVPAVKEPGGSPAAPADDTATPAGTDQLGRQLYDVKCAKCGKQTQVPFKPSGDRPVYCRDCYMEQRKGGMGRG